MKFRQWLEEQLPVINNVYNTPQGMELRFMNPSLDAPLIGMAPTKTPNQWWVKTAKTTEPFLATTTERLSGKDIYNKWLKIKGWNKPQRKIKLYRGIAGEFIPYSAAALQERKILQSNIPDGVKGDTKAEIQWLKDNNLYKKAFALSRVDKTQDATTSLQSAIDYAVRASNRTKQNPPFRPPFVIAIEAMSNELPRPTSTGFGLNVNDVYDFTAEQFANLYHRGGKILTIPQAMQLTSPAYGQTSAVGTT